MVSSVRVSGSGSGSGGGGWRAVVSLEAGNKHDSASIDRLDYVSRRLYPADPPPTTCY